RGGRPGPAAREGRRGAAVEAAEEVEAGPRHIRGGPMNASRRSMLSLCLVSCVLLAPMSSHEAPATTTTSTAGAKEARIRELMRITGMANLGNQMLTNIIGSMRQTMPKVPDEFWRRMSEEAKIEDLMERVIPIYSSHFTLAEIDELIDFYSTPI